MSDIRDAVLRRNFDYFQTVVGGLMKQHAGRYALIREQSVVETFARPVEAVNAGHERFADGLYSVQRVTDRPLDLGFLSYGSGERAADRG